MTTPLSVAHSLDVLPLMAGPFVKSRKLAQTARSGSLPSVEGRALSVLKEMSGASSGRELGRKAQARDTSCVSH